MGFAVFAVAGLSLDEAEAGNYTGHVTVQLSLPPAAFGKIKTPVYWEPAADGQCNLKCVFCVCCCYCNDPNRLHHVRLSLMSLN